MNFDQFKDAISSGLLDSWEFSDESSSHRHNGAWGQAGRFYAHCGQVSIHWRSTLVAPVRVSLNSSSGPASHEVMSRNFKTLDSAMSFLIELDKSLTFAVHGDRSDA